MKEVKPGYKETEVGVIPEDCGAKRRPSPFSEVKRSVSNGVGGGYKDTEVGVIPEDWEVKKLGEVGESLIGLTYSPVDVKHYGTLVLRSSNIQDNKLSFKDNVYVKMELPQRVILKENDLLICVRNGSKNLIGKCALIDKKTEGSAFGAFMSVYRSNIGQFIFHQFQSDIIQKQLDEIMGATINQITNRDMANFQIPLPPSLAEQEKIATALSDTDSYIEKLEKLIEKKKYIKTGAMQELLTGKKRLPEFGGGKGYKETEVGVIPEDWEVKKLGDVASIKMGQSPLSIFYNNSNIGLPLVQGNADLKNRKTIIRNYTSYITKKGSLGDVIMSVRAPVGEIAISVFECCLGRGVCAISYPNKYLYHYMVNQENNWSKYSSGSTFDSVNSDVVFNFPFALPPTLAEQEKIAEVLSDMDLEIEKLEGKLEKYKNIKQGMMQKLLTGAVRLV